MTTNQHYLNVDGARLCYQVKGNGPDLVLIHGFSLDQRMWQHQIPTLSKQLRVISYDVRGFGRSTITHTQPSSNIDDLQAILNACQSQQATIVGHSMSGIIATDFAIHHPQRIHALILSNAIISHYQWSQEFLAEWSAYQALAETDIPTARQAWLGSATFAQAMQNPVIAAPLKEMLISYSGWHWTNHTPVSRGCVAPEALSSITLPTLVIRGEQDIEDYQICAQQLLQTIPGSKEATIKNSGHFSNMEQPEAFNQTLLNFLKQTSR